MTTVMMKMMVLDGGSPQSSTLPLGLLPQVCVLSDQVGPTPLLLMSAQCSPGDRNVWENVFLLQIYYSMETQSLTGEGVLVWYSALGGVSPRWLSPEFQSIERVDQEGHQEVLCQVHRQVASQEENQVFCWSQHGCASEGSGVLNHCHVLSLTAFEEEAWWIRCQHDDMMMTMRMLIQQYWEYWILMLLIIVKSTSDWSESKAGRQRGEGLDVIPQVKEVPEDDGDYGGALVDDGGGTWPR